jgi:membrane-bound lytic murein transglycosylase B
MKLRYSLTIFSVVFIFLGCTSYNEQVKKVPDHLIPIKIEELKHHLTMNGVSGEWFDEQIKNETFQLHPNIGQYFHKSAEKQTDRVIKRNVSRYFTRIGVDAKIKKGKPFIEDHIEMFNRAEAKHGIHKELIAAIIGIETNFADYKQRGKFYAFNSLVSQYIFTNRTKFAVHEITALYKFSLMTERPTQYFTSSYAGAIGWGQFIPSSLFSFFIDSHGTNNDIDPFDIEDTIFSVENYLYNNNLTGENIGNYNRKYKAVFAYNHSDVYVKAVLYIYDGLRIYFHPPEPEASPEVSNEQSANN